MKLVKKGLFLIALVVFVSLYGSKVGFANQVGFSIEPVLPENQIDKNSGYFHLKLDQGTQQELTIILKNRTDKPVKLKTSVASATTNINGVVDYDATKNKLDKTAPVNLSKQVNVPQTITLEPQSQQNVPIIVTMPDKKIPGVIAGGITFEEDKEATSEQLTSQTAVKNKFSYVVALLMQQQDVLSVKPNLELSDITPTQLNTKTSISAAIRNTQSAYLNDMTVAVSIYKKGDKKPTYEFKKEKMQLAPNSIIEFPTFLNGNKLEPGDYEYVGKVTGRTNDLDETRQEKMEWTLKKSFTIKPTVAKSLNDKDTTIVSQPMNRLLLAAIAGNIGLVLGIIGYVVYRVRKKKKIVATTING